MNHIIITFWTFLSVFTLRAQVYENFNNDSNIKTIQLYNVTTDDQAQKISPSVRSLSGNDFLILEFDDLLDEYRQFHVKVIRCDAKWELSEVRDLQYMAGFNDIIVNNYQNSQGTKVSYFHYAFRVPDVKMSGNYVLQLFEDDVYGEPLVQRRFRVFENKIGIEARIVPPVDNAFWRTHQQLDISLNYGKYPIRDPKGELIVAIRQNHRDEKLKTRFKPSGINLAKNEVYFRFFENENLFEAGNEFRVLDMRSTFGQGVNVASFEQGFRDKVITVVQKPRHNRVYLEQFDLNGRYIIANLDNSSPETTGDYLAIDFTYRPEVVNEADEIYVLGKFNDFKIQEQNRCELHADASLYHCTALLKQGAYDFVFAKKLGPTLTYDESVIEGDFRQTGNTYEVFVYHRSPGGRDEQLLGYALIQDRKGK